MVGRSVRKRRDRGGRAHKRGMTSHSFTAHPLFCPYGRSVGPSSVQAKVFFAYPSKCLSAGLGRRRGRSEGKISACPIPPSFSPSFPGSHHLRAFSKKTASLLLLPPLSMVPVSYHSARMESFLDSLLPMAGLGFSPLPRLRRRRAGMSNIFKKKRKGGG